MSTTTNLMQRLYAGLVAALLVLPCAAAAAPELNPPADPRQSINYWKQHTISADADPQVARSHAVFSVLLRGWDSARLEPALSVVDSTTGAWAASLADGNILLSREAIEVCMGFGEDRGEHLLAFVLAHELAHQRSDDLWHQRFFRMVGNDSPATRQQLMRGLQLDAGLLADLERKEAQADHDGLILMSSVGYDPYQILDSKQVDGRDFFTAWVENIWQQHCDDAATAPADTTADSLQSACRQAQTRALRTNVQLENVATQAMLYELGVQAFVARRYQQAREYFSAYGRDYSSRAVISALGLTWLAEAQEIHHQLIASGSIRQPAFHYPLMLDRTAQASPADADTVTRRGTADDKAQRDAMRAALEQGIQLFEKAIKLEPAHGKSYLLLATAHLLDSNTFMARGVLQGRYLPRFGDDPAVDMLLAVTTAIEGKHALAGKAFASLHSDLADDATASIAMPKNLLVYSSYFNAASLADFVDDAGQSRTLWKQLAMRSKRDGNSLMFRLALGHLKQGGVKQAGLKQAPTIGGLRLGDTAASGKRHHGQELWINGERFTIYNNADGSRYVSDTSGSIVSASHEAGKATLAGALSMNDKAERPFKTLGMPDRRLDMLSGEYLAYDRYGLAVHIIDDRISGWFLYHSR